MQQTIYAAHTNKQCDQFSTTLIKRHLQLPQAAAAEIWHRVQSARNCRVVSAVYAFVVIVDVVVGAPAAASFAIKCMVKSRRRTRTGMQMQLPLQLARC